MSDNTASTGTAAERALFGRREMLQRTGFVVGAAALWATPVVQTIGMRPAAATGPTQYCEGGPSNQSARLSKITFEFVGDNDPNDTYDQNCSPAELAIFVNPGNQEREDQNQPSFDPGTVCSPSEVMLVGATGGTTFFSDTVVDGQPITIGSSGSTLDDLDYEVCNNNGKLTGDIHTSCSQKLCINDRFGALKVIGFELVDGTVIS